MNARLLSDLRVRVNLPTRGGYQRISENSNLREPVVAAKIPKVRESRYYHSCNQIALLNATISAYKAASAPRVRVPDQLNLRPVNTYKIGGSPC